MTRFLTLPTTVLIRFQAHQNPSPPFISFDPNSTCWSSLLSYDALSIKTVYPSQSIFQPLWKFQQVIFRQKQPYTLIEISVNFERFLNGLLCIFRQRNKKNLRNVKIYEFQNFWKLFFKGLKKTPHNWR